MKKLLGAIIVLLLVIACVGFYLGWFSITTNATPQKSSTTITVDKDKIKADELKAKERVKELVK